MNQLGEFEVGLYESDDRGPPFLAPNLVNRLDDMIGDWTQT